MTTFERWVVWTTSILTAATGVGYYWARYLTAPAEPFSVVHHPLEPIFLEIHILAAPALVFALGLIAGRHVWQHLRSGIRRGRRSGIVVLAAVAPMILSGYLLQVLTGEGWLRAMSLTHLAFGLLYVGGIMTHRWTRSLRAAPGRAVPEGRACGNRRVAVEVRVSDGRRVARGG
ncbi:MAG: hypothetical protein ACE5HQ_04285 [Gemmatimonadota bacterium]